MFVCYDILFVKSCVVHCYTNNKITTMMIRLLGNL